LKNGKQYNGIKHLYIYNQINLLFVKQNKFMKINKFKISKLVAKFGKIHTANFN